MKMINDAKDSKNVKSQKGNARMKLCNFLSLVKSGRKLSLTSTSYGFKIEATVKSGKLKRICVHL